MQGEILSPWHNSFSWCCQKRSLNYITAGLVAADYIKKMHFVLNDYARINGSQDDSKNEQNNVKIIDSGNV